GVADERWLDLEHVDPAHPLRRRRPPVGEIPRALADPLELRRREDLRLHHVPVAPVGVDLRLRQHRHSAPPRTKSTLTGEPSGPPRPRVRDTQYSMPGHAGFARSRWRSLVAAAVGRPSLEQRARRRGTVTRDLA